MSNKKNSLILDSLSKTLPDERPITSLQIVENLDKCPSGFYTINKTYDQDQDADLWREGGSFLKKKSFRYLCLSKTEGLPNFVLQELVILHEKGLPPDGYSLLQRTADSESKAWRKKQLCYRLVNKRFAKQAITDIIICSSLKKAPEGFTLAGEINGVIICYKMGNSQSQDGTSDSYGNVQEKRPERPPKPSAYPSLSDGDGDYEILNPAGYAPSRPAPKPPAPNPPAPVVHQTTGHNTLSSGLSSLEGVPFMLNPKYSNKTSDRPQIPIVRARNMQQLLKDYNYDFRLERQLS